MCVCVSGVCTPFPLLDPNAVRVNCVYWSSCGADAGPRLHSSPSSVNRLARFGLETNLTDLRRESCYKVINLFLLTPYFTVRSVCHFLSRLFIIILSFPFLFFRFRCPDGLFPQSLAFGDRKTHSSSALNQSLFFLPEIACKQIFR